MIPDIAEDTTHLVAEKSTVEACLAANTVVVKTHSRGPRCNSNSLQDMLDSTEAGGIRSHACVASNRRSKLTPWWPSYLFEHFLGVNGRNTLKIFHVEEKSGYERTILC